MPWIVLGAFVLLYVIMGFRMIGMHSVMAKDLAARRQVSRAMRWWPALWLGGIAMCVAGNFVRSKPTVIVGGGLLVVGVVAQVRGSRPRRQRVAPPASAPAPTADPEP